MRAVWLHIKNFLSNLGHGLTVLPRIGRTQIVHTIESFSKLDKYISLVTAVILLISGGFLIINIFLDTGLPAHYGGTLTEGLLGQPQFINPVLASSNSVDSDLARVVFAQLLKYDAQSNLTPDLAASLPEISKDKKTYTLKLKPGLKWQDGLALTADDVVFTIQTIQNPDYLSALRANWIRVKVTKLDDLTLQFKLNEVSSSFVYNFALAILPKHIWENLTPQTFRLADANFKAFGSGPFAVDSIKKTADGKIKSITLKANKYYYQGRPFLNYLTFKFYDDYNSLLNAYLGREIQALGLVPFDKTAFLLPHDKNQSHALNLPQYQAVFFNLAGSSVLKDKAVRQALWLATNRTAIINDVYAGQVAANFGPILPESVGYNRALAQATHLSLDEAAGILDKGGWIMDNTTHLRVKNSAKGGKKTLEFTLVTSGNLVLTVKTAQVLQEQWGRIGAKINLVIVSPKELQDNYIRNRNFEAILTSENMGADPDPFPFWATSQSHDPGLNLSGFSNPEADKLLSEARQTTDPNIRTRDYLRFQEIINDALPAIFLTRSLFIYNVPKNLQGINLANIVYTSERFMNVNKWYFGK